MRIAEDQERADLALAAQIIAQEMALSDQIASSSQTPEQQRMIEEFQRIVRSGKPFTDKEFPPTKDSLADRVLDGAEAVKKFSEITWKRASAIFKEPKVYVSGSKASDINQGMLGDCYFLSTLGAAANDPERIDTRFYSK